VAADSLAPVRDSLLARARAEAHRLLGEATADADRVLAAARAEADEVLATARAEGEADAAAALADVRARARRRGRSRVLAARRTAYDELVRAARAASRDLAAEPGFGAARARLRDRARSALGPDAVLRDTDDGVAAEAGGRRVVLGLDGLADAAIDRLGADVEELWTP
jgi:vacuolar-type H+-ATPase subunit E/Vma4